MRRTLLVKRLFRLLRRWFSLGRLVATALLLALAVLRIADPAIVKTARGQAFDAYQRIKPRDYTPVPVAILDIDEASIQTLGQWPWPRTRMAELVSRLTQNGVVATAFDIVFSEPDRTSPDRIAADNATLPADVVAALKQLPSNDSVFAQALSRARIVLGQTSVRSVADTKATQATAIPDVPHAILGEDPTRYLPNYPALVQNLPELEQAAIGRGIFNSATDTDNVFRRVPMVISVDGKLRLSLSAELLRVATGASAFAVRTNEAGVEGIKIGRTLIATNAEGNIWPYLTPSLAARYISALDLINGAVAPNRLRGHLVLVGTSAVGLGDFRATPLGVQVPGVEIHAQALENILTNTMLVRPNYALGAEVLAIIALGLGAIILVPMLGATWAALSAIIVLGGYVAACWYAFDSHRLLIDPLYPTLSAALIFILMSVFNYMREEKRRAEIRSAFGQYVSPDVVDSLADNPQALSLGGQTRDLTILFSDVRGFTAISESYRENPQGLTHLMNVFLNCLSNAVLRQKGTIDKFMGDAIMAFWNAPVTNPNHPLAACRAALDMIRDVDTLNEDMKAEYEQRLADGEATAEGYHPINIGIGINTGTCVVGNMGSDSRFDYTALGDAVNLASRLEGQSKPYGIKIVLGQATAKAIEGELATFQVDRIRVKGKQEPETIFALLGDGEMLADPKFQDLHKLNEDMLRLYRSLDFESAQALLETVGEAAEALNIDIDGYLLLYELRIAEFSANPPGRDWDGVYTATTK